MQLLRSQIYLKFSRRRKTRKENTTLETGSGLVGNRGDKKQKKMLHRELMLSLSIERC